ncbi:MAG TPA: AsmA family protein [Terriglobales bacterium]|nr:AsmA family protein [Terriglobales bacterium]
MKKKPLIILGSIVLFVVLVAVALPLLINAEQFRPLVESQAKAALGRDVKVGRLELSLWRGGVVAEQLQISDDPAFNKSPFVVARSLEVGVEMLPMILSREAKVTSVELQEPQITLMKNNAGKWNFDSLGTVPGAKPAKDASAKRIAPPPFTVQDLKISDGKITIVQAGKQRVYENVDLEVKNFSTTSDFPFTVSASAPGGGTIKVNGNAGPLQAGDMTQTPLTAEVEIKDLELAATGFVPAASGIAGRLDYSGKIQSDGKKLHSEGKATTSNLKVSKGGAPAQKPVTLDYASDLDLVGKKGTLIRGDILIGQSKAKLTGDFDTRGEAPLVNARFRGDNMALDQLSGVLPAFGVILPAGTQLQGGTVTTDLQLRGPLDRMVITGPIQVANAKLNGFNLKSRASAVSALAGMPSASDLVIQALNSKLRVAPEGIRADGIQLILPGLGTVSGDGIIGVNNGLDFKMRARLVGGGGLIGGMSALSTLGQSRGEIPFMIRGTTSNPVFVPDLAAAMGSTMKAPVQGVQDVGGMFGGLFGKKKK